ncbi:MAG: hypothetical protein M3326_09120, partial [Actinomycetota bacterium]|nr:hypothetical protein [Actinomycetota bacterium]
MVFVAAWLIAGWAVGAVLFKGRLEPVRLPGGSAELLFGRAAAPSYGRASARRRWQVKAPDVLLPTALGTWIAATRMVDLRAINDWGLFPALPIAYFVALGLLVLSIVLLLTDARLSPIRLGLHLVALVVVLHGTVPLLFPEANYPWVYKHVGVVNYINAHGRLDPSVDIYQNWPGFFAVAAWFTELAGVASPLAFAKWAPVYFNLLICLELAFVFRWLPVHRRVAWLGMFVFAAGNWVGQDYFAPQALGFVLSLAVFGMTLALLQTDRPRALVRVVGRLAGRTVRRGTKATAATWPPEESPPALTGWPRHGAMVMLFMTYGVLVVTHQLSPFLVLLGIGLLAQAGLVRPWWVVAGLGALAIGYFFAHLGYLQEEHHLMTSPLDGRGVLRVLSNPFDNAHSLKSDGTNPMLGRRITALGAPVLILGMWALAGLGAARRMRAGKPTLLLAILTDAPALLAFVQNYGGE